MSDPTILYVGIACFSLIALGCGLTVREFRKLAQAGAAAYRKR